MPGVGAASAIRVLRAWTGVVGRDAIFEIISGVVGPIGCCVPMPRPAKFKGMFENAGVLGAAGGRDPENSKSKVLLLVICNERSNDMFAVLVFDVSDNDGSTVNKMSDRMSNFSCGSTLSAVNKNVMARAVEVFAYGDFSRSKSRT